MINIPYYTPLDDSMVTHADIQASVASDVGKGVKSTIASVLPQCGKCEGDQVAYCGPLGFTVCRGTLLKLLIGGIAIALLVIAASGLTRVS